ncbi:MAG: CHAT domain-containing protein, partial [Blastocatellia bacterium]
ASLLANLKGRSPAPNDVAVFADPVYSADDARLKTPRLEGQGHKESGSAQPAQEDALLDISRAAQDFSSVHGTIHFPRLASSGWEGQKIYDLAPAGKRLIALDFDASHEKAKKPALSEYKIVHFSAHGLIDDVHPELSAIVLSLVDGHGRAIDGFLRLQEIYNLNLPAELVMLNACETGLGEQVRGEGLVGLTRGFMYAGAARVIVTNWTMRDRAAAVFAVRFYGKLLSNHASALRALHETQVEMATRSDLRQWRAPYFWSGYTFMGVQ